MSFFTPFAFVQTISAGGGGIDPDAQAFITATGISGTDATAINQLVLDFKSYGLWSKYYAYYPLVGGTSTTCKYNLINPVDSDAAYRLVFNGGWTFSSNGALGNGSNTSADTFFNVTTNLPDPNSFTMGYYGRVANPGGVDMGISSAGNKSLYLGGNVLSANICLYDCWSAGAGRILVGSTTDAGLWIGSRTAANAQDLYKDGTVFASNTATETEPPFNDYVAFGATKNPGSPSYSYPTAQEYCSVFLASGFTSTDAANAYTAIQAFNTTLGRNV